MLIKTRQLYRQNNFDLPIVPPIDYKPFKNEPSHIQIQNFKDNKIKQNDQQYKNFKPTFSTTYNSEFQIIIGQQNMYPLFVQLTQKYLIICQKDRFIIIHIDIAQDQHDNKESFIKSHLKLGFYHQQKLIQIPTSIKANHSHLYFGMASGKIICYDLNRKTYTGTVTDFVFPVLHIQIVKENLILAIDNEGNLRLVEFSHKMFLDKIIKTLTTAKELSVIVKTRKRQKVKRLFTSLISKKQPQQAQLSSSQVPIAPIVQTISSYTKFAIPTKKLGQLINPNHHLIAIIRKSQLLVLTFDQQYDLIDSQVIIEKDVQEFGMLQFGLGGFQSSNNTHLLLVLSIKHQLIYYKGVQAEEKCEWVHISTTHFVSNILDGKFISNNLLILITCKSIQVCNVNQSPSEINTLILQKFSYINFFIQEQKLNFDKNLVYFNMLKILQNHNIFICLQGKRLIIGSIDSWKAYLQHYIDQYQFQQSMIIALDIYNRKIRKLCHINQKQEIRNQQMKQFFEKITLTYISYQMKKQNLTQSDKQNMIFQCLHFLIKTQSFQYLFSTIWLAIQSFGLLQVLMTSLQCRIKNGQIKVMTQQVIQMFVSRFKKFNRKDQMQLMIKNFDLNRMDKSLLLIVCLKQQLYQSMIHICNQHGDFISPILKLCGIIFTQKVQSHEKDTIKQMLFFYIKQCLQGHNTQFGNDTAYIQMLVQLINFLFIPSTLDMLIKISCVDTVKAINMFFQTKILQFILQNEGKFFIKKNAYIQLKIFDENCINEFKVYQKMLATLIYLMDAIIQKENQSKQNLNQKVRDFPRSSELLCLQNLQQDLKFQVNKFLCYLILKNQFPFILKFKIQAIHFFIQNMNKLFVDNTDQQNYEIIVNSYFMRLMDSILRTLQGKQAEIQQNLNSIYHIIESSNNSKYFSEAKCYILHELSKFNQILSVYLEMKNIKLKNRIFSYLEHNLVKFPQLNIHFINNINLLMKLNITYTKRLIQYLPILVQELQKIIQNLFQYPQFQLSYIQLLLQKLKNDSQTKIYKKLLLLHLQIVIRNQLSNLPYYVKKIDYPLEQAFKICQKVNNKIAKAYLFIKSGRNLQAMSILCHEFLALCDRLFWNISLGKIIIEPKSHILLHLFHRLDNLLQTCSKQFNSNQKRGQQIWQKCLSKIFSHLRISQNIKSQLIPEQIKQILYKIVQKILKRMFQQLQSEFFIKRLCLKFPNLPFNVFIIGFTQVYSRMQFKNHLQYIQNQLYETDQLNYNQKLMKQRYKGYPIRYQCQLCREDIFANKKQTAKVITYPCTHSYHKQCLIQNKQRTCPICVTKEEYFILLKTFNIQCLSLIEQNIKELQTKKKIQKLMQFQSRNEQQWGIPFFF